MNRHFIAIVIITVVVVIGGAFILMPESEHSGTEDAHGDEHASADEHQDEERHVEMDDATVQRAGIRLLAAGTATISEIVPVIGRIALDPRSIARIGARFPGTITELRVSMGDVVQVGDTLAVVESNESLQRYALKSSVNGTVVRINGNLGSAADNEPVVEIVGTSRVWAEFHVFPNDLGKARAGQNVAVKDLDDRSTSQTTINSVLPVADETSQSVIARALLENLEGLWTPGMTVRGDIAVDQHEVPVAVATEAIQMIDGQNVVFVREGDAFEVREVTVGESDGNWIEIVGGITAGETYAAANSFLLKAELGKSATEHSH